MPSANQRDTANPPRQRENLIFYFGEPVTAVVRLRSGRQPVSDAQWFRSQLRESLKASVNQARESGYASEDVKLAAFAVVGFLDESILTARNPTFADWASRTLQEELFGTNLAGEIFFDNVDTLLARPDSSELADLLEVHQTMLLLGFSGRYSAVNQGELQAVLSKIKSRIVRIRGPLPRLSPEGLLPGERPAPRKDAGLRMWMVSAVAAAVLLLVCFVGFKIALSLDSDQVRAAAAGQGS
jgi:type VI secretion system protein ImpK